MNEASPGRKDGRGQAESIGTVLVLGIVIVSVSGFGVFYLSTGFGGANDATGGSVNVVGDASVQALELTHSGGRSVPLSDLRVAVRNASGTTEYGLHSTNQTDATDLEGDGDGSFDAGETWRLNWTPATGEEIEVTLVDDGGNRILYRESFVPGARSETSTTEPTATPDAGDSDGTETPVPTTTPGDDGTPPSAVARGGTVRGHAGESLTLDGSGTTDADGDTLTYEWRVVDRDGLPENASRVVDDTVTSPNATFEVRENVTDRNYTLTVRLVADDGHETASDAATVEIEKINRPPVADAGEDAEMNLGGGRRSVDTAARPPALDSASPGHAATLDVGATAEARRFGGGWGDGGVASVTLDGSGSFDPDRDELTYEWEVLEDGGLDDELELSDANAVRPTLSLTDAVIDRDRNVTVRLTVTDDDGATDTDTVNVRVAAVDPDDHDRYHGWVPGWLRWLLHLLFGWL